MLILRRKEGQWLEITHRSGDVIRIRVCNIRSRYPGQLDLVLDDTARNFLVHRPERSHPSEFREATTSSDVPSGLSLPVHPGPDPASLGFNTPSAMEAF